MWIAGAVLLILIATPMILLATHWPFTRASIVQALEEASGRQVQIRTFSNSYLPPGCVAEGIQFLRHKHPEASPIITIDRLVIRSSLTGFISSPKRLALVRAIGVHMIIPPKTENTNSTSVLLNAGPGGQAIAISEIALDDAVLEFMKQDLKDKPYVLKVDRLRIWDVGSGRPWSYQATLTNTVPPGVIRSQGTFGPWNPAAMGSTPVSGMYTYDNVDLAAFESLAGKAKARGKFSGPLSQIAASGSIDVAGFHVDGSDHAVPLAVTYDATVDGVNGDVQLHPAVARYRRTQVEVRGSIAGHKDGEGKTATFDLAVPVGRVDDLLYLFSKGEPGMTGDVAVTGTCLWPPGPRKFLQKISLDLALGMKDSRFASPNTQGSIDAISKSAEGESKKAEKSDPRTMLAAVRGNIRVREGTAELVTVNFQVPGADAVVRGTYNLLNKQVALDGTLDTRGDLSDATSGFKSVVLKAVLSLSKKENSVRVIPFHITGNYENAALGIDWKKDLLHRAK
jgi:hypothetical protein